MIIYNKRGLKHLRIWEEAEAAYDAGLLSELDLRQIKSAYPDLLYRANLINRIGYFILMLIGCSFTCLLITLLFESAHVIDHPAWPLFLGLCSYAALELLVRNKSDFHSGIDDALLWFTAGLLGGGLIWALSDLSNSTLLISACILLLSSWFALRFVNTLMSSIACLAALALVFFTWNKAGAIGEATMPFVIMLSSYLIYNLAQRITSDQKAIYYQKCLMFVKVTSLLSLYAAGNYLVVQKLSNQLHHLPAETNDPIPFGWIFWGWTCLLPLVYIALGIRKRSLLLLRVGLILIGAAAYTVRFYFQVLSIEYVLVISGALVLSLIIAVLKYLKTPKLGFTYAQRSRRHWLNNLNLESLIVAGLASHTQSLPIETKDRFGGGSFGGGGASSNF